VLVRKLPLARVHDSGQLFRNLDDGGIMTKPRNHVYLHVWMENDGGKLTQISAALCIGLTVALNMTITAQVLKS